MFNLSDREMVDYFVDGTEVDVYEMIKRGLVEENPIGEFYLTEKGVALI